MRTWCQGKERYRFEVIFDAVIWQNKIRAGRVSGTPFFKWRKITPYSTTFTNLRICTCSSWSSSRGSITDYLAGSNISLALIKGSNLLAQLEEMLLLYIVGDDETEKWDKIWTMHFITLTVASWASRREAAAASSIAFLREAASTTSW